MPLPHSVRLSLALAIAIVLDVSSAAAQPVLDRVVGLTQWEEPLVITKIDGQTIGTLSKAADVPMGFEGLPPLAKPFSIRATKRSVRDVLDALVAVDPRYEWRDDDGVIVVRPVDAWNEETSLLNTRVQGVMLRDVAATDLFGVLTRMVSVPVGPSQGLGDTKRFSLEVPEGATLREALNAVVRAHGTLTWAIQLSGTRDRDFPASITLFVGSTGVGFGIPANRLMPPVSCCGGHQISSSTSPAPGRSTLDAGSRTVTGKELASDDRSVFDRIVGSRPDGRPLVAFGVGSVRELATAVHVPMGLEWLPPPERPVPLRPGFDGMTLTGMTLQNALATLIALDPRYEWRDVDGVIVFRPVAVSLDPSSPLLRIVPPIRLQDATVSKAIGVLTPLLGAPEHARNAFPDTRTFSIDLPRGSLLDVLNGITRSHGELCWEWEPHTLADTQFFGGRRFTIRLTVLGGGGLGFAIP